MNMNKVVLGLIVALLINLEANAQRGGFKPRMFVGPSLGAMNYIGDLDDDFYPKFTKLGGGGEFRVQFNTHISARAFAAFGRIGAKDGKNTDQVRKARNLSFRSDVFEFSAQLMYDFFASTRKYRYRPMYNPFVFAGVGVYHFNPKAKYDGKWYALQPLGTEGQNIPGSKIKPYSLTQICIPFGAGLRVKITNNIDLNFEMGFRYLFTDYLDDVSTKEAADPFLIKQYAGANGDVAFALANRANEGSPDQLISEQYQWFTTGQQRGDPTDRDWYSYTGVTLSYYLDWVRCPKFK